MSLVEDDEPLTATPLEFLTAVYMNEAVPLPTRLKAATEAAQYIHPRLSVTAMANVNGDFGAMLERAITRSNSAMKLIEAQAIPSEPVRANGHRSPEEVSAERMGKGFAPAPLRRRF